MLIDELLVKKIRPQKRRQSLKTYKKTEQFILEIMQLSPVERLF